MEIHGDRATRPAGSGEEDRSTNVAAADRRPQVLVVEDSTTQATLLRFGLEEGGYTISVARNGAEGLSLARAQPPALIISDVVMPEMDGYALCRAVKSDPALAHTPVILVTTLSSPTDVIKGLECGADNFVRKPYDLGYLLSRINYLLANHDLRSHDRATGHVGVEAGIEIQFGGHRHFITSARQQILDLLISTYEQAVQVNEELLAKENQLRRSYDAIEALYRLATDLNRAESPSQVFEVALAHAVDLLGGTAGWVWIAEGDGRFRCVAAHALPASLQAPDAMEGTCDCQQRLLEGRLGRVVNIVQCERACRAGGQTDDGLQHASVPLRVGDETIGIMNLVVNAPLAAEGLTILDGLANHVAATLARVRLQEQLKASNQELEAFAYSVSHDLRAPIRHMDGFADLLLKRAGSQLDETATRYVHTIQQSATKMSRLIDDLLGLSRTGRTALQPVRVELDELVREVQQDIAPALNGRQIVWGVDQLPAVQADPGLLRIVFVNLLSNAIKFTAPRSEARIEIRTTAQDGEVIVHVCDNGAGFDMQYADKLFGVFQRLHTEEQFEGTGIGLATVRRIITRHGGRVWAEGAPDRGATFSFSLPRAG
ncbi:MAG: response regulator [Deltaproteobacteria bacterium]|nr:response regulator [Deltaproteobacteria bacterium]